MAVIVHVNYRIIYRKGNNITQYIDKSTLMEEIKRQQRRLCLLSQSNEVELRKDAAIQNGVYCDLLSFINNLEVKEVDPEHLEREVEDFCNKYDDRKDKWYDMTPHDKNIMTNPTWGNFARQLAKHFFELGLNAQKGE